MYKFLLSSRWKKEFQWLELAHVEFFQATSRTPSVIYLINFQLIYLVWKHTIALFFVRALQSLKKNNGCSQFSQQKKKSCVFFIVACYLSHHHGKPCLLTPKITLAGKEDLWSLSHLFFVFVFVLWTTIAYNGSVDKPTNNHVTLCKSQVQDRDCSRICRLPWETL